MFFPAIISGQDVLQDGYPDSVIMIIKSSELEIDSFGVGGHTVTLNYYNNNNFTGYAIIESETNLRDFGYIRKPINKKLVENEFLLFARKNSARPLKRENGAVGCREAGASSNCR